MKKIEEIETASKIFDDFDPENDLKDQQILELESEGHKVLAVSRGVAIIEQYEYGDGDCSFGCENPIKVTVFGDKELCDYEGEVYIHGGKYGLREVYAKYDKDLKPVLPVGEKFQPHELPPSTVCKKNYYKACLQEIPFI